MLVPQGCGLTDIEKKRRDISQKLDELPGCDFVQLWTAAKFLHVSMYRLFCVNIFGCVHEVINKKASMSRCVILATRGFHS